MENFLIDYQQLWKNGMGLHETQFEEISKIIFNQKIQTIVEFGSGGSTQFLTSLREHYGLSYMITSFDHNEEFAFKGSYGFLKLITRNLVNCNDEIFEKCFQEGNFLMESFTDCQEEQNNFRVKNAFYGVTPQDLPNNIDLVILDGPNGNGRSLAFPLIKNRISENCWVLIDDEDHYDFVKRCQEVFETEVIKKIKDPDIHPLFSYCLIKIRNK